MSLQDIYKKAGVVMKPAAMKIGKLYSQQPHSGAGDFNFSRADGVQTRINKHGLIETVANNEPRLSYDIVDGKVSDCPHLLLEPSRSNYLQRAEEFSNSYWTKYNSSISPDETVAPDGAVAADKLVENTVNTQHEMGRAFGFTSGVTYTVSVFAKSSERNLQIRGGNTNTFPANSNFDLSNGTIQSTSLGTAYIEDYGNGWYRCVVKATAAASSTTNVNFRLVEGSSSTYTGDGSSGVFLWGVQNEIGLYPTSYIPTEGSSETRFVDSCSKENLPNDVINASYPFTMYVEGTYNGQLSTLLSFLNKDSSQEFFLIYINNNEVFLSARSNGTIERIESGINLIKGQKYKIAVTMNSATSGKICVNGNSVTVRNNFSSQIQNSDITDLLIGQERIVSDGGIRSSVSGVELYNTALTDTELQKLTS